jgi:hypothetical protein
VGERKNAEMGVQPEDPCGDSLVRRRRGWVIGCGTNPPFREVHSNAVGGQLHPEIWVFHLSFSPIDFEHVISDFDP